MCGAILKSAQKINENFRSEFKFFTLEFTVFTAGKL